MTASQDKLWLGELVTALRKGSEAATWTEALNLCAQAADALTSLIAERDGGADTSMRIALKYADAAERVSSLSTRAIAAEAQLKAARELADGLNVTDQELVRINNMCVGFDGDVKIWAKMLHKLAVFAIAARTALSLDTNKGDGV